MKMHILDTTEEPANGSEVKANCNEKVVFYPIKADLEGSGICKECLEIHRSLSVSEKFTFAIVKE